MIITGSQFVASGSTNSYTVTGIPVGYTLNDTILPIGWVIESTGIISGGSQTFSLKVNSNSGTFVVYYINEETDTTAFTTLDISVNATKPGVATQTALVNTAAPKTTTAGGNTKVNVNTVSNTTTLGFLKVQKNTSGSGNTCPSPYAGCPFTIDVFADADNPTNPLNNDQTDFLYQGNALVENITMSLQKANGCGGPYTEVLNISSAYQKQAQLAITIGSWEGNQLIQGTFTIGAVVLNLYFFGDYTDYLTYLAAQINANAVYSATVQGGGITIYGKNGALSNGIAISQKISDTANSFQAFIKGTDTRVTYAGLTLNALPITFGNVTQNQGGNWNAFTGIYTAGTDPTQVFAGGIQWSVQASIPADYRTGLFQLYLKKNGTTVQILYQNAGGNGVINFFNFTFDPITLAPGDQVEIFAYTTLTVTGGSGIINIGGGATMSSPFGVPNGQLIARSTATTTTNWGTLSGGLNGASTFCKWFPYGLAPDFSGNPFTDDYGNQYKGALLQWLPILQTFGAGNYQMVVGYTMTDGSTQTFTDNRVFCLRQYDCNAIDRSVRVEVWNIGIRGSLFNSNQWTDYGSAASLNNPAYSGWYSQIRVSGIFYEVEFPQTREYNQYGDDVMNAKKPIILEANPKYILELAPIPGWMDWYFVINVSQADTILMTDYNSVNRNVLTLVPVIPDGSIKPKVDKLANPLAMVEIAFEYGQNNLRRRND